MSLLKLTYPQQQVVGLLYSLHILWLLLTTWNVTTRPYWSWALCVMSVCRLLNNPIIAAQLSLWDPMICKETVLACNRKRVRKEWYSMGGKRRREKRKRRETDTLWDNVAERKRQRVEKGGVNEWRRKKPLRDSVALCVCVCSCERKKKTEGKKTE